MMTANVSTASANNATVGVSSNVGLWSNLLEVLLLLAAEALTTLKLVDSLGHLTKVWVRNTLVMTSHVLAAMLATTMTTGVLLVALNDAGDNVSANVGSWSDLDEVLSFLAGNLMTTLHLVDSLGDLTKVTMGDVSAWVTAVK